jgi:hypothetical protein
MASSEFMKIVMGYEDKGFNKGVARSMASIDQLNESNKKLVKSFDNAEIAAKEFNRSLANNNRQIDGYRKAIVNSSVSVGKLGKGVKANAVPAMQEFSRVIQDAPYGIQGVANNIQQLTAQFQYLAAKSGGAKAALKGMVGALAGPAGILLAVSAVTAAAPFLIEALSGSKKKAEEFGYAMDDLNTVVKRSGELFSDATFELNEFYNAAISAAKAAGATELAVSKIAKKALEDKIALSKKEVAANKKAVDDILAEQQKLYTNIGEVREEDADNYDEAQQKVSQLLRKNEKLNQEIVKDSNKIKAIDNENFQRDNEERAEAYTKKLEEEEKERLKNLKLALAARLKSNTEYYKAVAKLQSEIRGRTVGATNFRTEDVAKSDAGDIAGEDWVTIFDPAPLLAAGSKFTSALETVKSDTLNLGNSIVAGFTNFGEGIADAIASGSFGIDNAGALLMATFGDLLTSLGRTLVAYGVSLLAFQNAFSNPIGAIVAGTAAMVIGGIFSKKAKSTYSTVGSAVSGGSSGVGGGGSASFSGSTASTGSFSSGGGTVVFEIEGQKLVGVLSNTLDRNRAIGGSNFAL